MLAPGSANMHRAPCELAPFSTALPPQRRPTAAFGPMSENRETLPLGPTKVEA